MVLLLLLEQADEVVREEVHGEDEQLPRLALAVMMHPPRKTEEQLAVPAEVEVKGEEGVLAAVAVAVDEPSTGTL